MSDRIQLLKKEIEYLKVDLIKRKIQKKKYVPIQQLITLRESELAALRSEEQNKPTSSGKIQNSNESENKTKSSENKIRKIVTMEVHEFLALAAKVVTKFDGKAESLQTFIDSINLANLQVGAHTNLLIALIKTKLEGSARNLITNENTIAAIVDTLKRKERREST